MDVADLSWIPPGFHLTKRSDGYISGIVNTEAELSNLLENHRRATLTTYNKWSRSVNKSRHLWKVEDYSEDTPLVVLHRSILACQHGKAYSRKGQDREKKRIHLLKNKTGKVDCPAKLYIRHVTRYDTFSVKGMASRTRKNNTMKRLKQALFQNEQLQTSTFIHVRLPLVDAHRNHSLVTGNCFSRHVPNLNDTVREEVVEADGHGHGAEQQRKTVKVAQVKLRKQLKTLLDASYLCHDLETLQRTTILLKNVLKHGLGVNKQQVAAFRKENIRPRLKSKAKQAKK